MTDARRAKRPGKPARQKTPEQRRQYTRQIATVEGSSTADLDLGFAGQALDSTVSAPSPEQALETPPVPPRPPRRSKKINWTGIMAAIAGIGLVAAAVAYVVSMKSDIASNAATIRSLERSQESLGTTLRHEIQRVEAAFERRLREVMSYFRGRSPADSEREIKNTKEREKK